MKRCLCLLVTVLTILTFTSCRTGETSQVKDIHEPSDTYASTLVWTSNGSIFKGYCKVERKNCLPLPKNYMTGYKTSYATYKSTLVSRNKESISEAEKRLIEVIRVKRESDPVSKELKKAVEQRIEAYRNKSQEESRLRTKTRNLKSNLPARQILVSDYQSLIANIDAYLKTEKDEQINAVRSRYTEELKVAQGALDELNTLIRQTEKEHKTATAEKDRLKAQLDQEKETYEAHVASVDIEVEELSIYKSLQNYKQQKKDLEILFQKIEQNVPFTTKDIPPSVKKVYRNSHYLIRNNHLSNPGHSTDLTPFQ